MNTNPTILRWPSRASLASHLDTVLTKNLARLPGIVKESSKDTLILQMVASVRRLQYTDLLLKRSLDENRANPTSSLFDPERAAIIFGKSGNVDEAIWLVFLSTHFGKHPKHGWKMLQDIYSGLGGRAWTWARISASPNLFRLWIQENATLIGGAFGNHRKYESINGDRPSGTGAVVESYVNWIGQTKSHAKRFAELIKFGGNDPHAIFDCFYQDMNVARFGRLGKFDFLCMLGRLNLAPITPGRAYLGGATGPLRGARLLYGGDPGASLTVPLLETQLSELDVELKVGMQVIEDSLCNWQKSPEKFIHFKG